MAVLRRMLLRAQAALKVNEVIVALRIMSTMLMIAMNTMNTN